MMTTSSSRESQCMADINITPFTDVLLVLLIIFIILAAVAAPPGFQKQLSSPRPKFISDPPLGAHQIQVEVTAKDRISLDGKPICFAQLYQMMAATIASHDRQGYSRHIALSPQGEPLEQQRVSLGLSYDHRIINGRTADAMLLRLKKLIEEPEPEPAPPRGPA